MVELTFLQPKYLWLLLVVPFLILTHFYGLKFSKRKAMKFSNFEALARITGGNKLSMNLPILFLRFFTLFFLILALSGPILWYEGTGGEFNFLIAIDASGSMLADDFSPNRLDASKEAALEFLERAPEDSKVGVMSFSGNQFVKSTLSSDKEILSQAIRDISIEFSSGTAVGDAIMTATNILLEEDKGRVVILLTDGQSNVGTVLERAINYANEHHATITTIGVGTSEGGNLPDIEALSKLDEKSLISIAQNTGGNYYRAQTNQELIEAYRNIARTTDKKIPIQFSIWLIILTFLTLAVEWVIVNTKFRSVP